MSFSPVLPAGGLVGWSFLQRTAESQKDILAETPSIKRLTDTVREKIADVSSAAALVEDRELLTVALTAFGLEEDINSKFFIQKIMEQDTSNPSALANKLSDKRYLDLAETFGFGSPTGPKNQLSGFADKLISNYETKQFETQIGDIDADMRLALSLAPELTNIANGTASNDAKWFTIMGNPPLRQVFEAAFGLPSAFGTLEIDRQLEVLKENSNRVFKTDQVSDLVTDENLETLTNTFLLRSQLDANSGSSGGSIALTLLQSAPRLYDPLF